MTESIAVRIGSPPSIEVTMVAVGKALAIDCIKPLLTPLLMPVAVPVVEVCLMTDSIMESIEDELLDGGGGEGGAGAA